MIKCHDDDTHAHAQAHAHVSTNTKSKFLAFVNQGTSARYFSNNSITFLHNSNTCAAFLAWLVHLAVYSIVSEEYTVWERGRYQIWSILYIGHLRTNTNQDLSTGPSVMYLYLSIFWHTIFHHFRGISEARHLGIRSPGMGTSPANLAPDRTTYKGLLNACSES